MMKLTNKIHNCHKIIGLLGVGWLLLLSVTAHAESLFDPASYDSLVSDMRSQRLGDVVTVMIIETARAEARTSSDADRELGFNGVIRGSGQEHLIGIGAERNNGGKGVVQRSGTIRAQLSAVIDQVLPNGDLHISGRQSILVNDELQEIEVKGIIRKEDVDEQNMVVSTRIRNMDLSISGEGFLADNQKPSWLSQLLQFLGF